MDYSKQSDFGINNLVAIALGAKVTESYEVGDSRAAVYYELDEEEFCVRRGYGDINCQFDPCNNPADAWPIIVERKINIEWHEWKNSEWKPYALNNASTKSCYDNNPLRAAMVVFLMMQESANVQDNPA
ncbi:phage protein NinX family protein [Citrobacter freundii]|uniref:phage protein NinX family protein n=1 Tax=Citrobacter freundii TaxID=546 RepID=UPI003C704D48